MKAENYVQRHSGARLFRASPEIHNHEWRLWIPGPREDACPGMTVPSGRRLQRLLDLGLEHAVDILRRHRADQLVDNGAVAADHEGFRHAVDAPFDRGAAVGVDPDHAERVAVAAEEAAGVVGRVL